VVPTAINFAEIWTTVGRSAAELNGIIVICECSGRYVAVPFRPSRMVQASLGNQQDELSISHETLKIGLVSPSQQRPAPTSSRVSRNVSFLALFWSER
jgi:hypothetical protein